MATQRTINGMTYTFKLWSPDKTKNHKAARVYITQDFHGCERDYGFYKIHSSEYQAKRSTLDLSAEVAAGGGDDDSMFALLDEVVEEI